MFEAQEISDGGISCSECRSTHGIHTVLCPNFWCHECKQRGADEDHRGGCPTKRRDEIRWQCQCGTFGWMNPTNRSLAGLVRQARREHKHNKPCGDPDIEQLETRDDAARAATKGVQSAE